MPTFRPRFCEKFPQFHSLNETNKNLFVPLSLLTLTHSTDTYCNKEFYAKNMEEKTPDFMEDEMSWFEIAKISGLLNISFVPIGQKVAVKCKFLEYLSKGASGFVYKAENEETGGFLAVKVFTDQVPNFL
jgi:hypothetical protein